MAWNSQLWVGNSAGSTFAQELLEVGFQKSPPLVKAERLENLYNYIITGHEFRQQVEAMGGNIFSDENPNC